MDRLFGTGFLGIYGTRDPTDFHDIRIEIFCKIDKDVEKWHSDKKSDEPHEMLREKQDEECDEYGKFHIGRDDFRIEVVCLDRMDDHRQYCDHRKHLRSSVIESDKSDGDRRDEESEHRNKPKYEHHDTDSRNERKCSAGMNVPYCKKSEGSKYRIGESNDGLSFENKSESFGYLLGEIGELLVDKGEIPFFYTIEILLDFLPINEKYITQNKGDEDLEQKDSGIFHVLKDTDERRFDISFIHNSLKKLIESKIESHLTL